MSKKRIREFYVVAALVAGLAAPAAPAHAGFEWVAPSEGTIYQAPLSESPGAVAPAAPVAAGAPEAAPPVIISGTAPSSPISVATPPLSAPSATRAPEAVSPVIISGTAPSSPISVALPPLSVATSAPENEKPDLATATISIPAPSGDAVVQGFGAQIPLALAMRQILPVGYNFSIDQDVGMDTLVSYTGGKPWRATLKEMLAPVGLVDHEQGTTFTISRASPAAAPVPQAASMSPLPDRAASASPAPAPVPQAPEKSTLYSSVSAPLAPQAAAPPAEMPPTGDVSVAGGWSAERGDTLHKVLSDWCRRANVELQWLAEYDYPIEGSTHFDGGFEHAVRGLLSGFAEAHPQPIGELHMNSAAGQKVLVIQARGNSYTN